MAPVVVELAEVAATKELRLANGAAVIAMIPRYT